MDPSMMILGVGGVALIVASILGSLGLGGSSFLSTFMGQKGETERFTKGLEEAERGRKFKEKQAGIQRKADAMLLEKTEAKTRRKEARMPLDQLTQALMAQLAQPKAGGMMGMEGLLGQMAAPTQMAPGLEPSISQALRI